MADVTSTVQIKVQADVQSATANLGKLERSAQSMGEKFKGFGRSAAEAWSQYDRIAEKALRELNKTLEAVEKLTKGTAEWGDVLKALPGPIGEVFQAADHLVNIIDNVSDAFGGQAARTAEAAKALAEWRNVMAQIDLLAVQAKWRVMVEEAEADLKQYTAESLGEAFSDIASGWASNAARMAQQAAARAKTWKEPQQPGETVWQDVSYQEGSFLGRFGQDLRDEAGRRVEEQERFNESARGGFGFGRVLGGAFGGIADKTQAAFAPDAPEEKLKSWDELIDKSRQAESAFGVLASGVSAGVDAAISGQMSIGAAIKQALAVALKAKAIEAAVQAAWHTAAGVGSLAFGPIGGASAAAHFKAAALYAGVAALAGVGSSAMGGGAAAGAGGYGGATATPSGFSAGSGGGGAESARPIVVNLGYGFFGDAPKIGGDLGRVIKWAERTGNGARKGVSEYR